MAVITQNNEEWRAILARGFRRDFADGSFVAMDEAAATSSVGRLHKEDLRETGASSSDGVTTTLADELRRVAERDVRRNIIQAGDTRYLGAGSEFGPKVFTRDIAFSGLLGLNSRFPALMVDSLRFTRAVRRRVGFKVPQRFGLQPGTVPWEPVALTDDAFVERYGTNAYLNRTDDVCWLAAMVDVFERHPERADWAYLAAEGAFFFATFYDPFFDATDGLYRGQASFVDIGYPNPLGTGYDASLGLADRVQLKALSTNCLYVSGLAAMATAATQIGDLAAATKWQQRRAALIAAIRETFQQEDGTLAYYKFPDGRMERRRDALGSSLAVLTGVVTGAEARAALAEYPMSAAGVPLFAPFFPDPRWYHNHSSWPFVDTFFLRALSIAEGRDYRPLAAALLASACSPESGFREVRDYRTGEIKGSGAQLWTAAAWLGLGDEWVASGAGSRV